MSCNCGNKKSQTPVVQPKRRVWKPVPVKGVRRVFKKPAR